MSETLSALPLLVFSRLLWKELASALPKEKREKRAGERERERERERGKRTRTRPHPHPHPHTHDKGNTVLTRSCSRDNGALVDTQVATKGRSTGSRCLTLRLLDERIPHHNNERDISKFKIHLAKPGTPIDAFVRKKTNKQTDKQTNITLHESGHALECSARRRCLAKWNQHLLLRLGFHCRSLRQEVGRQPSKQWLHDAYR